jgi:RHS repeat-associated protein
LTDSTGTVQTQYTYEPFGKTSTSGSSNGNSSQYTGRENDGTGLYYYRTRYYSPSFQRFISEDPIGLLGGINLYAYAGNNPISFTDPLGLKPNNPGDDSESEKQRRDIEKMLRGIIDGGKNNLDNVVLLAGLEGGGAIAAERLALNKLVAGLATRSASTIGPGAGHVYGTRVHTEFAAEIRSLRNANLSAEVSYLNGDVVPYGTPGSVRVDAVAGPLNAPHAVYDLKTGSAQLGPARIQQIQSHLPGGSGVPVYGVRP